MVPSACSTRQRCPVMRWQPWLSSNIPETRTKRPLILASCTLSSERSASSSLKLSNTVLILAQLHMFGQGFHARVKALLATDIGFGLRRDYATFTQRQLVVGHQTPKRSALRCQIFNSRALFRIKQNANLAMIGRHSRQRFFSQRQQLCGMQSQFATDDLLRNLFHQLE